MGIGKDKFIELTGGYRFGESPEQFKARVAEIQRLEADFRGGKIALNDLEKVQRRLCELKGISWDEEDEWEEGW